MSAWDRNVAWRSEIVTPPDELVVSVDYVRDAVLRVVNGDAEDEWIERAIKTATRTCELRMNRALPVQQRAWIADRFPCGKIVVPAPPFIDVVSLEYVDANGDTQTLSAVSPQDFQLVPSGRVSKAEIWPLYGQTWPVTRCQPDAVTLVYDCGYAPNEAVSPAESTVPEDFITGICLMVGELYKQRSLSVQEPNNTKATLNLDAFWPVVF